jgi:uncharacterized protein (DUF2147 family)
MIQRSCSRAASALAGAIFAASSGASAAPSMEGFWMRADGLLRARVTRCGQSLCATNVWTKNVEGDEKVGDRMIVTLIATSPGHWIGSGFDVRRRITFDLDVSGGGGKLTTRACVSGLCRTEDWTRT